MVKRALASVESVELFLPAELEVERISEKEALYENALCLEESDFVIAPLSTSFDFAFELGLAYGQRKQIITFTPRSEPLSKRMSEYVDIHIMPDVVVPIDTRHVVSDYDGPNFLYESGLRSALSKLVRVVSALAPLYATPHTLADMLQPVVSALNDKWRNA